MIARFPLMPPPGPGAGRSGRWARVAPLILAVLAVLVVACSPGGRDGEQFAFERIEPTVAGQELERPTTVADALGGTIVGAATGPSVAVHRRPSPTSGLVVDLANPTDIGGPLVFQLVGDRAPVEDPEGWVEVRLPIRPNGSTGWVRVRDLSFSRNPYRIEIDTGDHALEVYRDGSLWIETSVAIGTGATPTPLGEFYITELLQPPDPGGLYGPFAFGLSGFSETLQSFAGGDGVIGIHGTDEPEALGTDVSHGCVRVHNDVISELAGVIPLGTPVSITA